MENKSIYPLLAQVKGPIQIGKEMLADGTSITILPSLYYKGSYNVFLYADTKSSLGKFLGVLNKENIIILCGYNIFPEG